MVSKINKTSFYTSGRIFSYRLGNFIYADGSFISSYNFVTQNKKKKDYAVILFIIQLILNLTWSYLFFDMQSINLALADVILIFAFLIPTMYFFFKISKLAGFLLIPYLLQVIFAIYLTMGLRILN